MTNTATYDANRKHNVQIIEFCDGSKYVTARTDQRTSEDIEKWKRAYDHFAVHSAEFIGDRNALSLKLDTHTIRQITNVGELQGISKAQAIAAKHALIKGLRALGHEVINRTMEHSELH